MSLLDLKKGPENSFPIRSGVQPEPSFHDELRLQLKSSNRILVWATPSA
ncbi:hypothetical protein [Microbulbifer halophilus]